MKRGFFFLFLASCLLSTANCFSQDSTARKTKLPQQEKRFWDRVYTGGGLGLGFGDVTVVNVSPIIGYRVTEAYSAGIGATYIYIHDRRYIPEYSTSIYGGSLFNRVILFDFLIAHAELEILNGEFDPYYNRRVTLHNIWLGGGLRQPLGGSSYIYILALWNINPEGFSDLYFPSPQIRGGIAVGL